MMNRLKRADRILWILLVLCLVGCRRIPAPGTEVQVRLYFADGHKESFSAEERTFTLQDTDSLPLCVMEALIAGPSDDSRQGLIPELTQVRRLWILDRICYVDLSADFTGRYIGTDAEEELVIGSIVRSLTQIPMVDQVQLLIEGQIQETYAGSVRIDTPLS